MGIAKPETEKKQMTAREWANFSVKKRPEFRVGKTLIAWSQYDGDLEIVDSIVNKKAIIAFTSWLIDTWEIDVNELMNNGD